jgi:hypothetical protein
VKHIWQPEINYKKVRGAGTKLNFWEHPKDMRPPPFKKQIESTLRTSDPHPSKSKLWTGPKRVKLRPILVRIGVVCVFFLGDSEYGTPVAIWEMLHNSKKHQQTQKHMLLKQFLKHTKDIRPPPFFGIFWKHPKDMRPPPFVASAQIIES